MWNFSFVFPTLLVLSIILLYYFSLPHLRIRKNLIFLQMIAVETLVIIFDIASSYADNVYTTLPPWLTWTLNILFFLFFFLRAYIFFLFTVSVLGSTPGDAPILAVLVRIPIILSLVVTISSPITRLIFYIDVGGYHSGPLYNLVYFVSLFYIAAAFFATGFRKKNLKSRRRMFSIVLFNIIVLSGVVIRKMLPTYLLMDTFCLMAILVIYLGFENPEFYLDLKSTAFSFNAFREFLDEYRKNPRYLYFGVVLHNYNEMREIYGSAQMDNVLHMISRYLKRAFPKVSVFYFSLGRFIIVIKDEDKPDAMRDLIAQRFARPWLSEDMALYLGANYAFYYPQSTSVSSEIIIEALQMALAKADRINDGHIIDIGHDELMKAEDENRIKRCFEKAIENDEITVFLQPLIDVNTKKAVGAEALARLFDSDGKIIPPDRFIPIAERTGLINDLGEQVFKKVCRFINENDLDSFGIQWININLSPLQLIRNDLSARFAEIAASNNVPTPKLHLEITEEAVVDETILQKQISALNVAGFPLVLDDYGTGYSNLTRIKRYPFVNIKLDLGLVWDYCKMPDEILPTMVQAFKHMGFGITAEGIEDENMASAMEQIGCDFFQGFYYSKPVPMSDFLSVIPERIQR